jgi:hypothetical protein
MAVQPLGGSAAACVDGTCALAVGVNIIRVVTLAEDDLSTLTYTIVVTRAAPSAAAPSEVLLHDNGTGSTHQIVNQTGSGSPLFTMQLQLPSGAYSGTMGPEDIFYLIYTEVLSPTGDLTAAPAGLKFAGNVFTLDAFFNDNLLPGYVFPVPFTLVLTYDAALLGEIDEESLELRYWNVRDNSWSYDGLEFVAHDAANTITYKIYHLTEFSWFAQADPTALEPWPQGVPGRLLIPSVRGD